MTIYQNIYNSEKFVITGYTEAGSLDLVCLKSLSHGNVWMIDRTVFQDSYIVDKF